MTHEDRPNGVFAWERVLPGDARVVALVNAGRSSWQAGQYGAFFGDGTYQQVYCSNDARFGGSAAHVSNGDGAVLRAHGGTVFLNVPPQSTLIFKQGELMNAIPTLRPAFFSRLTRSSVYDV